MTSAAELRQVVLRRPAPNHADRERTILDGVSFTLAGGEVLAIVGPSGAGKSTLLQLVNRFLDASAGQVLVAGKGVGEWAPQALRRHAALAFQSAPMLPGTLLDNLAAPLRLTGGSLSRSDAEGMLAAVELAPSLLDQDAGTLSGGQQQRVALLRTLAPRPAILLADEITSALDADTARVVEGLLLSRVVAGGLSVLWVTHNEPQARRVADRILRLEQGRVAWLGPAADYPGSAGTGEELR